jgi:hypothetical protein
MVPLPEAAATCVGASSTSAASAYSCSASQTDVRHARSTFSQYLKHEVRGERGKVDYKLVHEVEIHDDGAAS